MIIDKHLDALLFDLVLSLHPLDSLLHLEVAVLGLPLDLADQLAELLDLALFRAKLGPQLQNLILLLGKQRLVILFRSMAA